MPEFLRKLFKPPTFKNEEDTYSQGLFIKRDFMGIILMPVPYVLFVQITTPQDSIDA